MIPCAKNRSFDSSNACVLKCAFNVFHSCYKSVCVIDKTSIDSYQAGRASDKHTKLNK